MLYAALKVLLTAVLVVAISEAAKHSTLLGGILASLPLTSLLGLYLGLRRKTSDRPDREIFPVSIFWYVLPSLVLFVALPLLLMRRNDFWLSLSH